MVTTQSEKEDPLLGKEERHQQYKAFFAIVNLDEVVSQSPARKMVNLFQIKVPEAPISLDDENWRERYTDTVQFETTTLGLAPSRAVRRAELGRGGRRCLGPGDRRGVSLRPGAGRSRPARGPSHRRP